MKNHFTPIKKTLFLLTIGLFCWQSGMSQFTPGDGGNLPTFTDFTNIPGKIGGLFVNSSERENIIFFTGTNPVVNLDFPYPSVFGATSYTLQYSTDNGSTWGNYQYNGADLTTTGNNFSLNFSGSYTLRLLVNGGPDNGYTSNVVYAPLSGVDTYFSGWSIDESMYLTGIMVPWLGRGIAASFSVEKLSDNSKVTGGLTYQWYRVNPLTYESVAIQGATTLNYTTTLNDVGYLLKIRATGDGVTVGGFSDIFGSSKTIVGNKAFISNVTNTGFTLNLYETVTSLTPNDLTLIDKNGNPVLISSVTKGANAAIYNIAAALDASLSSYYLTNNSAFWNIATTFMQGDLMPGISVVLASTGINNIPENTVHIYPVPSVNTVHFEAGSLIGHAEIINVNGSVLVESPVNNMHGDLNSSGLSNGIYFLRLTTSNGVLIKKIQISR
jgi:hypothetical protein